MVWSLLLTFERIKRPLTLPLLALDRQGCARTCRGPCAWRVTYFPKAKSEEACFARLLAERLAFLWAVDPAETDALSMVAVQDFDGIAVEDGDDGPVKPFAKATCGTRSNRTAVISQIGLIMARLMAVLPD